MGLDPGDGQLDLIAASQRIERSENKINICVNFRRQMAAFNAILEVHK